MGRDRSGHRSFHQSLAGVVVICWLRGLPAAVHEPVTSGHTSETPDRSCTCGLRPPCPPAVDDQGSVLSFKINGFFFFFS